MRGSHDVINGLPLMFLLCHTKYSKAHRTLRTEKTVSESIKT